MSEEHTKRRGIGGSCELLKRRGLVAGLALLLFSAAFDANAAKKNKKPNESGPQVTFMGFRSSAEGKSIIFVEMTAPIEVAMTKAQGAVIFTLKGGTVLGKTNRYPLLMNEFGSPVVSAQLLQ